MSPVKTPEDSLKATSPSKLVQDNVNKDWGAQVGTTNPKQALADKHNADPYPVKGAGK